MSKIIAFRTVVLVFFSYVFLYKRAVSHPVTSYCFKSILSCNKKTIRLTNIVLNPELR